MLFGSHISTEAPFSEAINRAESVGCECMQIFANPPQRWNPVAIPEKEISRFIDLNKKANINPIVIHSIYLINLASSNSFFYEASIKTLIDDMKKAQLLGAIGANFHVGSTKGKKLSEVIDKIVLGIKTVLAASEKPYLILENSAGAGDIIGDKFEELAEIMAKVNSPRLKVTLDTAHAYGSGYNVAMEDGLEETLKEFDKYIGLENLVCLHLNDSTAPLFSNRDRHADIGKGYIGKEAFARIVNHPKLSHLPGIIETPNMKTSEEISDIELLKSLRK
ncbi:MAG: deoxyribonuclease IV [Candidatus Berkelbacteria bacterium]|nr:deoxyribonuclease IV [Candidatus Berkelbacteria bacterium]